MTNANSAKTLLVEMVNALDNCDPDKYWAAFQAVLELHEKVIRSIQSEKALTTEPRPGMVGTGKN